MEVKVRQAPRVARPQATLEPVGLSPFSEKINQFSLSKHLDEKSKPLKSDFREPSLLMEVKVQ